MQRNEELRAKVAGLKAHYAKVLEFAKKNSIDLKPRNVPGVNKEEYKEEYKKEYKEEYKKE